MAVDPGLRAQAEELFAGLGDIRCRPMFGGLGVYADGLFFALAAGDGLYVKGDDANEPVFRAEGSAPFTYEGKTGEAHVMRYWRLPEAAFDDPEAALRWGRLGVEAALRARAAKPSGGAPRASRRGPRRSARP